MGLNEEQVNDLIGAAMRELEHKYNEAVRALEGSLNDRVDTALAKAMEGYNDKIEETARKIMTRRVHGLTIMSSAGVAPDYPMLEGETKKFWAEMRDREGELVRGPTAPKPEWTATPSDIMKVDENGLVTAMKPGTATLQVRVEGIKTVVGVIIAPTVY